MEEQASAKWRGRPKTGGRKKGTPNKRTAERRMMLEQIRASGKDPLTFFAEIQANEANPFDLRFAAAKELLPYMHPRRASIESRRGGKTHEERLEEARGRLARRQSQLLN